MTTEATPTALTSPTPPSGADPGAAATSPSPSAAPAAGADPGAQTRPAWLPEGAPDLTSPDFEKHYSDTSADAGKYREWRAGVPEKVDGYKVELKLPEGTTLPEGVKFDPAKDPRLPTLLGVAHKLGLPNGVVNELISLDAQMALAEHDATVKAQNEAFAAETKLLGDKALERRNAAITWANGRKEKGDFTAEELAEVRGLTLTAAGTSLVEKWMAQANGSVPGHVPTPPQRPEPKTHADRIWPGGFNPTPQAKVG